MTLTYENAWLLIGAEMDGQTVVFCFAYCSSSTLSVSHACRRLNFVRIFQAGLLEGDCALLRGGPYHRHRSVAAVLPLPRRADVDRAGGGGVAGVLLPHGAGMWALSGQRKCFSLITGIRRRELCLCVCCAVAYCVGECDPVACPWIAIVSRA